jgi:tetratricopeptide (TPR) repeat protein
VREESSDQKLKNLDLSRDENRVNSSAFSGIMLISAQSIARKLWWDASELRAAKPVTRFGNLFVFRGTLQMSGKLARNLYGSGIRKEYAEKPDLEAAEHLLRESAQADPSAFFVDIELGNIYLKRGLRDLALQEYVAALQHAPGDRAMRQSLEDQIRRLSTTQALDQIAAMRNPNLE